MKDFYRRVEFEGAWDRRDPNPTKDYGVHGVQINFFLVGENGAISWCIMTDWVLPMTEKWWASRGINGHDREPTAGPVGFHYPPEREIEYLEPGPCNLLGECRSDVGFSYGDTMMKRLIEEGEDGLWAEMIAAYETMQETEEQT